MRSAIFGLCVVAVVSAGFSACSSSDATTTPNGDAGAAGAAEPGAAGANSEAGEGGEAGASACSTSGTGTITVSATGLPTGVAAAATFEGPSAVPASATGSYKDIHAGAYTVSFARVYDTDAIVRTAYEPEIDSTTLCLADGTEETLKVTYSAIPSSNQLWMLNGNGTAGLLGFASSTLVATGAPAATTALAAPSGQSLAFDFNGNLWTGPATVADPILARYPAATLTGSAVPKPDVAFTVPAIDCVPALKGLALDADGNVWLSTCGKQLLEIASSAFATPTTSVAQDVTPSVTLSGVTANEDLAFDGSGNLWVADDGKVERFDKARLAQDDTGAPDLTLSVTTEADPAVALAANFLAFDAHGNLWALDFAGNGVFEIAKADLTGIGAHTVVSPAHLVLDVQAVLARPAFDDGGSLWVPLSQGKFGKLTPALLGVSTSAGAPTTPAIVISSADVGSADGFAFFPAASGLPLASAQP